MQALQVCTLSAVIGLCVAASSGISYNYSDQAAWGNIPGAACSSGTRQSPINVVTSDLRDNDDLIALALSGWGEGRTGVLKNVNGKTVKFTPNNDESNATMKNHQGTYFVLQFHIHWGPNASVGSEHTVNGRPVAAEIHFVHRKTDGPDDVGNAFAVVGVMAVADDDEVEGVWNQLAVSDIRSVDATRTTTVRFDRLLPDDLSYYYYEGSLTTPLCSEVVQWFLLAEPIKVPTAFLQQLRMVERNSDGDPLLLNYRDVQPLNDRTVSQYGSATSVKPLFSVMMVALSLSVFSLVRF